MQIKKIGFKKTLSLLLAILIISSSCCCNVFAGGEDKFEYDIFKSTVYLSSTTLDRIVAEGNVGAAGIGFLDSKLGFVSLAVINTWKFMDRGNGIKLLIPHWNPWPMAVPQ